VDEVTQAIDRGNVNLPTGTLYGANQAFIVQATGQLNKAAEIRAAHRHLSQWGAGAAG